MVETHTMLGFRKEKVSHKGRVRTAYVRDFDSIYDILGTECQSNLEALLMRESNYDKNVIEKSLMSFKSLNAETLWKSDVAGEIPIVPSFVSGDPACMRYRTRSLKLTTPIRIFAPASTQAGVTNEEFAAYTGATLGAIMAMSRVRPVELRMFTAVKARKDSSDNGQGGSFITWKIPTNYFTSAFAAKMANMSVGTNIGCSSPASKKLGFCGQFHFAMQPHCEESMDLTRQALRLEEQDVLLPEINCAKSWYDQIDDIVKCATESGIQMDLEELKKSLSDV